jgi:mannose-6-phosphate isomerase-like protein (cupin superfamily)
MSFATLHVNDAPEVAAPDGSAVHVLVATGRGSMARFTLPAGAVSRAVMHRTVDELWYFVAGRGRMWLHADGHETIIDVSVGSSVSIPVGTAFQFRALPGDSLQAIGVTMPAWPGEGEALVVDGRWEPSV